MAILIRNFGNDTECFNISELEKTLTERYQNKSVSIVNTSSSGMKNITLVDVQHNGVLIGTHCKTVTHLNSFNF